MFDVASDGPEPAQCGMTRLSATTEYARARSD